MDFSVIIEKGKKIFRACSAYAYRKSYSQCGEDIIVRYVFNVLKLRKPTYLDVGAHHPVFLSNTYAMYKKGSAGVLVEPDPTLYSRIRRKRRRDVSLNVGVADESGILDFYVMSSKTLNTFSKDEAENTEDSNVRIENTLKIPVITINEILEEYFPDEAPDFLSVDVEGMDLEIIKSMDIRRWRPKIICAETLSYSASTGGEKLSEIHDYLNTHGYRVYADTYINTVFIDSEVW